MFSFKPRFVADRISARSWKNIIPFCSLIQQRLHQFVHNWYFENPKEYFKKLNPKKLDSFSSKQIITEILVAFVDPIHKLVIFHYHLGFQYGITHSSQDIIKFIFMNEWNDKYIFFIFPVGCNDVTFLFLVWIRLPWVLIWHLWNHQERQLDSRVWLRKHRCSCKHRLSKS